jgi:hypothetical protein
MKEISSFTIADFHLFQVFHGKERTAEPCFARTLAVRRIRANRQFQLAIVGRKKIRSRDLLFPPKRIL